jgi:hypothetical protein
MIERILTIETNQKQLIEEIKTTLRNEMQSLNLRKAMLEVLFASTDHTKLLKAKQGFDDYIKKTNETLKELQIPTRIDYRLEGLDQLEDLKKKILQCGQCVEYSNSELGKFINSLETNRQLDLNGKKLIDQDMKIVADALRKTTVRKSIPP